MGSVINGSQTEEYIINHKRAVQRWMQKFSLVLMDRGEKHDNSKLQEPEFSYWCKMDEEPRYRYGTKEYKDKIERYRPLFEIHWKANRHHPEYFNYHFDDVDLIDLIEMLCDWLSYRDKLSYTEASDLVHQQCQRYGFSEEKEFLLLNTLKNHFIYFGGVFSPEHEEQIKISTFCYPRQTKVVDIKA